MLTFNDANINSTSNNVAPLHITTDGIEEEPCNLDSAYHAVSHVNSRSISDAFRYAIPFRNVVLGLFELSLSVSRVVIDARFVQS